MRQIVLAVVMLASMVVFGQDSTEAASAAQPTLTSSKGCLAVKPIGSHGFRNVMMFGVAGAIISKEQYQVLAVVDYPARVGQKFHGNDLQTIQGSGARIVILNKHYKPEELENACK